MAIKIIDYTVDISGMTPLTEKDGGTQGDHRVTALKFTLSKELNDAINAQKGDGKAVYRFDIYDGEGGKWSADTTELTGEVVSFELEERHTRYGGKITVYLVLSVLSNDQETEVELYSFPAVLRLKNLPSGVEKTGENYESISSLAEAAKTNSEKAIQSAEVARINSEIAVQSAEVAKTNSEISLQSAESAASSAEKAIESAALSSAEAERAEKTLNCRIPKAVNQETPPFSQTVSIKSNAEYEQINEKWFPKDTDYTYHNIDDGFYNKTSSYAKGFIATRDKTTGNLWTDTPIDDEDCANKKYVDEKTVVDQTYNANSLNAQSGKAVAQALENIDVGDKVDVIYRENATTDIGYTEDTLPFLYAMLKNNVQGLVKTAMGEATPLTIPVRDGNGVVEVGLNIPDEDKFKGPAVPLNLLQKRFDDVNLKAVTAQNQANANKSYIKEKRISSYWLTYSSTDYGTIFNESGMYFLLDITGSNTIRFCDTSKNNLKDTGNSEITNKFNVAIVIVPEGVSKNVNSFQQSDVLIMGYKKGSSILTSSIEARQVFVNSKNSGNKGSFTVYDYIQVDKSSIPKDGHLAVWKISLFDDMIPTE